MLPWVNPDQLSPNTVIPPPPPEAADDRRAGIRCQKMLAKDKRTMSVPVLLHSVLDRRDYDADLGNLPTNVVCLRKSTEARLVAVMKSMLRARGISKGQTPTVFVVHGHDTEAKESVARFIEKLGMRAIVLHEQPSLGRTIIEKFEAHSDVTYAVVLMTPDDLAKPKTSKGRLRARARQNVIFELGFFAAKLGRRNVCALHKPEVEVPTDYEGVVYVPMDSAGAWRSVLAREMRASGLPIDISKIL